MPDFRDDDRTQARPHETVTFELRSPAEILPYLTPKLRATLAHLHRSAGVIDELEAGLKDEKGADGDTPSVDSFTLPGGQIEQTLNGLRFGSRAVLEVLGLVKRDPITNHVTALPGLREVARLVAEQSV